MAQQLLLLRRHQDQLGNLAFRPTIPLCQTEFDQLIDPFEGTHYKKRGGERERAASQEKEMLEIHRRNSGSENEPKSLGIQGNKIVTHFVFFVVTF